MIILKKNHGVNVFLKNQEYLENYKKIRRKGYSEKDFKGGFRF